MPYVTSVEELGFERGHQAGRQEGWQEGERLLILRRLVRRVGALPAEVQPRVESLSLEQKRWARRCLTSRAWLILRFGGKAIDSRQYPAKSMNLASKPVQGRLPSAWHRSLFD